MKSSFTPNTRLSSLVNAAISSHNKLYRQIDEIEDQVVRMMPPYDADKLQDENADWANNWSFGKGKSQVERLVSQAQQQIANSFIMMSIDWEVFDMSKHKDAIYDFLRIPYLKKQIGQKIVRCFLEAIDKDKRVIPMIGQTEYNSILFGYGCNNPTPFSYLGESIHRRKLAFPPKSKETTVSTWITFDTISMPFLLEVYTKILGLKGQKFIDSARSNRDLFYSNWNIYELTRLLEIAYANLKEKHNVDNKILNDRTDIQWPEVGIYLKDSNCYTFVTCENIHIAKVKELSADRKEITEHYVVMDMSSDSEQGISAGDVLFKRKVKFKENEQLCLVRDFSVSPSQNLEDISGMGIMIAEMCMRYNRTINSVYDKVTLGDCLTMQQSSASGNSERAQLSVGGGQLVMPNGWTMTQEQYRPNLAPQMALIQREEEEYRKNTYHYDPQMNLTSRPTKDEVQARQAESMSVRNTRMPVKLIGYSSWLTRCIKNLTDNDYDTPEDKKVQDRFFALLNEELDKFGLSKENIKKVLRSIYSVSLRPVLTDINAIKEAMALADTEQARAYLQACYLIAIGFSREDISLILSAEFEMGQLEIASIENALFQTTGEIVFTPGQDHITHLNTHYPKLDREFQSLQQGKDPVMVFNYVGNSLENCEKHLEAIKMSPFYNKKFKEFLAIHNEMLVRYKKLAQYVQQMKKQAEQQAQEAAQGQQQGGQAPPLTPDEQIEIRKAEQALKFEEIKGMQKLQQKQQVFEQRLAHVKELKQAQSESSKNRENSVIRISEIKAAADSARKMTSQPVPELESNFEE